ncbi:5-azacytidine-induced protein 2 isoform X1 [Neoarius graeffei]|uniref:5-azacytidine-induced protein 2 isoform X1 n=1 Tax=Neoarius graeffei TaxID=443677 RepID=UPI00298C40B4|nr:5-azacytidine-induced protein 2 isoform X1 [Neoarius graeffei]XP_060756514.1 5-azacytidine-induced protein 2 isoform X1 [Neoarius graeffei]
MESPQGDDDICILKHETAYAAESPVAVCSGDESVASHFALVTAYEDIKKRLRDTEKENTLLRKRVKQLEDKLFRPEAPPSEGPQYMNKAFSAYRGIYMEKQDLQAELNKLKKERSESEKILNEQLQAKELELLQLRSEMETSQVMKSLNETQDYWHVNRESSEVQINTLQEEVQRLRLENNHLHTLCTLQQDVSESSVKNNEIQQGAPPYCSRPAVMSVYEDMCSEVYRLHTLVRNQSELMKKLRDRPALKRATSAVPVQCLDDVEKNHSPVRALIPRPPSAPPLHVAPPPGTSYTENWKEVWPLSRPSPLGSPAGPPIPLQHVASSSDDGSWSIPAHPTLNHPLFWEEPKSSSPEWSKPN